MPHSATFLPDALVSDAIFGVTTSVSDIWVFLNTVSISRNVLPEPAFAPPGPFELVRARTTVTCHEPAESCAPTIDGPIAAVASAAGSGVLLGRGERHLAALVDHDGDAASEEERACERGERVRATPATVTLLGTDTSPPTQTVCIFLLTGM